MTKELPKLCSYNMNDGRIYVGICDEMDWENKVIKLKEANLFLLENRIIGSKNYEQRVKELYKSRGQRTNYSVSINEIRSAHILF